jgi:hypothetical protein
MANGSQSLKRADAASLQTELGVGGASVVGRAMSDCRTSFSLACSGSGDRRGGAEHQTHLLIDFMKWSLLECVLRRDEH